MKLSIIIPTCNEAAQINKTIGALLQRAGHAPQEIIVVDCGSADGTFDLIRYPEVVKVCNPLLAGKKWASLRLGARLAQGEVLLFVDADTLLPLHYDRLIEKALEEDQVIGGAFELSFEKFSYPLLLVTWLNRIRYRVRNRFYGDQAIFVQKSAYEKAGGWPKRTLLEAAYLCKNLQRYGRLRLLQPPVLTSSRRFTEGGVWKVFFHDIRIWAMDLMGMDVEEQGKDYWQKNQDNGFQVKKILLKNFNKKKDKLSKRKGNLSINKDRQAPPRAMPEEDKIPAKGLL